MRKVIIGSLLAVAAVSTVAIGAVPERNRVLDDTVIYQNLSEIKAAKEKDLNFDHDIAQLESMERQYREKLPSVAAHPHLRGPVERVATVKYSKTSAAKKKYRRLRGSSRF